MSDRELTEEQRNKNFVKRVKKTGIKKKEPRTTEISDPKLLPLPRMPAAGLEPARA